MHRDYGEPVSLIGWSLGGVYAREIAKEVPHAVRNVITLGTRSRRARARPTRGASTRCFPAKRCRTN